LGRPRRPGTPPTVLGRADRPRTRHRRPRMATPSQDGSGRPRTHRVSQDDDDRPRRRRRPGTPQLPVSPSWNAPEASRTRCASRDAFGRPGTDNVSQDGRQASRTDVASGTIDGVHDGSGVRDASARPRISQDEGRPKTKTGRPETPQAFWDVSPASGTGYASRDDGPRPGRAGRPGMLARRPRTQRPRTRRGVPKRITRPRTRKIVPRRASSLSDSRA
jgi:hypothetical protein